MRTRLRAWHVVLLGCLPAFALPQTRTRPDADLGEPASIPISDLDVARHMSQQQRDAWQRYRREGKELENEARRLARAESGADVSIERQALLEMRELLVQEFRSDFSTFLGISGTTVVGFGEPLPTGREVAGEMLRLRSLGWTDALPGYWVRSDPGDLQGFFDDPRTIRSRRELGPAAGREVRFETRYEERNRPAEEGGAQDSRAAPAVQPSFEPNCSQTQGPFGLSGCP